MGTMHLITSLIVLAAIECSGSQDGTIIHITGPAKISTCYPGLTAELSNGVDCNSHCNYQKTDTKDCSAAEGFFRLPSSKQCFKAFTDNKFEQWHEAQAICDEAGLVLAEPESDIVPELQLYLNTTIGYGYFWLNGRGSGSSMRWQRRLPNRPKRGPEVAPGSSLWYPGEPGKDAVSGKLEVTIEHCLSLESSGQVMVDHPGQPYKSEICWYSNAPLCERIME